MQTSAMTNPGGAATAQTLRPQGALMNWKKMLSDFLFKAGMFFFIFFLGDWVSSHWHFSSQVFAMDALGSVAVGLGLVGLDELDRGGHRWVRRIFRNFFIFLFAIFLILLGIALLCKAIGISLIPITAVLDRDFEYSFYPFIALIAAPFPLALYLNWNQTKSTSQPTSANVS